MKSRCGGTEVVSLQPDEIAEGEGAVSQVERLNPRTVGRQELVQTAAAEFVHRHERRRRQAPRAVLVGVVAGLASVAFRFGTQECDVLRVWVLHHSRAFGLAPLVPVAWCAIGATVAVALVRRYAPETAGSGIPHVESVLYGKRPMLWLRVLATKFIGGLFALGGGLALGPEGPAVQIGAAAGQAAGLAVGATPREKQALIAAGAGAGLAAAFNAPLAGMMFVLEELQRDFAPGIFTPAFLAAVTADVVSRVLMGQGPVFDVHVNGYPPLDALPAYSILGVLAGLLGVVFNRTLLASLGFFNRQKRVSPVLAAGVVGAAVGFVGWFRPDCLGSGEELVSSTLRAHSAVSVLLALFILRFVMTTVSAGCGAPGGLFAPLLVLGAILGRVVGQVSSFWVPEWGHHLPSFAAVGMAAFLTAIVRAPVTGVVLIFEMTGHYDLMLPLLAASALAYIVAELLKDKPLYEALLHFDLARGSQVQAGEGPQPVSEALLVDVRLHRGAPFEGRRVRDLGLPHGCLLVTVRRGVQELVPDADLVLRAGDQITAVIDASANDGVASLRHGTQRHGPLGG